MGARAMHHAMRATGGMRARTAAWVAGWVERMDRAATPQQARVLLAEIRDDDIRRWSRLPSEELAQSAAWDRAVERINQQSHPATGAGEEE